MKRWVSFIVCSVLFAWQSLAATWYVHAQSGSDSNAGTLAAPFGTLTKLATVMVSGDDAVLAGTFRESVTFTGLEGCAWRQWGGQSEWCIRGDTVIASNAWTSVGGGVYSTTVSLAGTDTVEAVVVNWDTSINANGLHYGHLTAGTYASLSEDQWGVSGSTLRVRLAGDANPSGFTIAWCRGGTDRGNGFNLNGCSNCVVDDFCAQLWVDSDANTGYGLRAYGNTDGNVYRINRTDDTGYHAVCVNAYLGTCSNNIIEPSRTGLGRCAGNASGGIPLTFYTTQANQYGNIGRDLHIVASPFLKRDGLTGTHTGTIGGVYSHTDGVVALNGVTWERIRITYPYAVGVNSSGVDAGNTTRVAAASEEDWTAYGVKAIECRIDGAFAPGLNLNAGMADVRCSYLFAGSATKSQSTGVLYSTASGVARTRLLDACEVMFNLGDSGSTAAVFVRGWTNDRWVFLNCSFAEYGTGTNERRFFAPVGSTASVTAKQCIFAYTASTATFRRFYNGDSGYDNSTVSNGVESFAPRVFEDCSYVRIVDTVWSSRADFNTQAEWINASGIDAGGQASTSTPFEEPAFSARLKRSHALWTYRDTGTSGHTLVGINRKPWTGTLGAYQYNSSATVTWSALTEIPAPVRGKPAVWVNFVTGAGTNEYLVRQDLMDDPEAYLERVFEDAGASGLDVMFYVPWGHNGTHYYTAQGPGGMPNQIRDTLALNMDRWRRQYNVGFVGLYGGAVWPSAQATNTPIKPLMRPDWEDWAVADVFDSYLNMGFDAYGFDAVANRGTDQYGGVVADDYNTLGGFCYHVCGLTPIGEALEVDHPVNTTDFVHAVAERSEFMIVDLLYRNSVPSNFANVLDGPLPATRRGFHYLYFASEFTREAAQQRVNQGYIVGCWEDVSVADMAWLAVQRPTALEGPVARPPRLQNRSRLGDRARLN